ncbi:unnamed protein product [Polarella glacialis]|uniref:Uncharacterized protein n=1 Tax=Polarella glacialis TaxID=89957 RepID=A0A813JSQ1_POLGL|nr:unnamed protein product [Polarella glacialis]
MLALSANQPAVPGKNDTAGLIFAKTWVMLDPSSEKAKRRSQERYGRSPFINSYIEFVENGMAKELMPDPFFYPHEPDVEAEAEPFSYFSRSHRKGGGLRKRRDNDPVSVKGCRAEVDMDYTGIDIQTIPRSSPQDCCRACRLRNKLSWPASCSVAVLSAEWDDPPSACWIKGSSAYTGIRGVKKEGVIAFFPDEES